MMATWMDDGTELREALFQRRRVGIGDADAHHERTYQCRHHIENGRDIQLEVGLQCLCFFYRHRGLRICQHGEECRAGGEGQQAGQDGVGISQSYRQQQQAASRLSDVGDGWGDQADDDERDEETQELTEHIVERHEHAHQCLWQHVSKYDPHDDGNHDARQQSKSLHTLYIIIHTAKMRKISEMSMGNHYYFSFFHILVWCYENSCVILQ